MEAIADQPVGSWPTVRPARVQDLHLLSAIRTANADEGTIGRLGASSWGAVLAEYARDPATILLVASDATAVLGYALATPTGIYVQRRAVVRSPRLWLDVGKAGIRHPRLIIPIAQRAMRLVRPYRGRPERRDPVLRLLDIVVAEHARGRGVGRALLDATLKAAAISGQVEIGLSVRADNSAAIRLYERAGFSVDFAGARGGGRPSITMRRSLISHTS